jgi:hypothetical protein
MTCHSEMIETLEPTLTANDEPDEDYGIDYRKLQRILEKQYGRKVLLTEAIGTGKFLLNVYENLLDNRGKNDKLSVDTINR